MRRVFCCRQHAARTQPFEREHKQCASQAQRLGRFVLGARAMGALAKLHSLFEEQGLQAADFPAAFVIHEALAVAFLSFTWYVWIMYSLG
jgi:hypothetical protein